MKGLITKIPFLIHIYTNTFQTFFFQKSRHLRSSAISSASRRRTTSAAAPPASTPRPSQASPPTPLLSTRPTHFCDSSAIAESLESSELFREGDEEIPLELVASAASLSSSAYSVVFSGFQHSASSRRRRRRLLRLPSSSSSTHQPQHPGGVNGGESKKKKKKK